MLLTGGSSKREFDSLGLGVSDLTGLFRRTPVPAVPSSRPSGTTNHSTEEHPQDRSWSHRHDNSNATDTWSVPTFQPGAVTHAHLPMSPRQFTRSPPQSLTPSRLPELSEEHEGLVPVNTAGHRIDTQL